MATTPIAFGIAGSLILCVVLAAPPSAHAGVVADETAVIDFLQMLTMETRVITSIEGDKARLDHTVRMMERRSNAADDDGVHSEIQRLDRGIVYSLMESARQYRERKLESPAPAIDSSRQVAAIASALQCEWTATEVARSEVGREIVGGATTAHVRVDASHRCAPTAPAGISCTLAVTYDQWSTRPNELHAQLARYRRDYAAKAGTATGIAEELMLFSEFGVPLDPGLLESIRTAVASEGQALRTNAVLRASRSCFVQADGAGDAATAPSTHSAQSYPAFLLQYVGASLLWVWIVENAAHAADGSADQPVTLGTISTRLESIRAQKVPASQFELPAGFTSAF
jgi:hypothetical protein